MFRWTKEIENNIKPVINPFLKCSKDKFYYEQIKLRMIVKVLMTKWVVHLAYRESLSQHLKIDRFNSVGGMNVPDKGDRNSLDSDDWTHQVFFCVTDDTSI